jgi:hypothetical protein
MKSNGSWRAGYTALLIPGAALAMSTKRLPGATGDRSSRFISRHLTFWLVVLILGATLGLSSMLAVARSEKSATSERQSNAQDQAMSIDGASTQEKSIPVLTLQSAPDIPQCRDILNQAILDLVNTASEDPAVTFERNRQAQPHSMMVPSPLNCASKLWMAVRRSSRTTEFGEFADSAMSFESLSLRQNPIETSFNPAALNASVATNNNLAGGIEEYQGTSSIAIDPNNPLRLIASSNSFYKDPTSTCQSPTGGSANTYGTLALFGSIDGGATWTYNCAPWPATLTGGVTGATFWFGSYPTLAWDNQGRAYVSYLLISQSASAYGAAIVVARSSDNGASWQSLGTVVNGIASTTQGNDKEMMAIDNTSGQTFSHAGRIYVTWQAANAQKIAFSDNGTAWTTVNFPSNTGASGGNLVIGADGTVYVIWSRYNVETIVFSKSTDGGATWTAPQVIATLALQSYGNNNKPPAQDKRGVNGFGSIDVDRNPASSFFGNLYVSFSDFPTGTTTGADLDTYMIRSTNGGAAWSSRVKINDDNFGATQMLPWLAVDQSDGTVNVSWYDTRLDPLNRKTQAVYARSTDGGVSFEPNVLVSDGGSAWRNNVNYSDENSTDNTAYNSNQFGDYSGLAALNRQAHPIWTDSRMFFPVADTQSPSRKEDTATATITNCSAPSAIAGPGVNPSTAPSVAISWSAPAGWGTTATNGTYSVFRDTSPAFPSGSPLASGLTSTNYVDTTGNSGTTYYYFVRAKNNCPGTALTPMSTDSPASASVEFGATGTPTGILQGTVTAGNRPLSGVVVTAGTFSATTNTGGYYLFAAINASAYSVSASPTGYSPVSVNGVVVLGGATTVQNLALVPMSSGSSCFTDTTYFDLSTGGGANLDIRSTPGDVKLRNLGVEAPDQVSNPAALSTSNNLSATTWTGQTFRAGVTGNLTKLSVGLGLASGTSGTITVEIRNINGSNPGTTVLATGTLGPVTNVGTAALYTTTFATPAALLSGTSYSIVLRTSVGSTVFGVRGSTAGGSTLANGQVFTTTNSGSTWTAVNADLNFTSYVTPPTTYLTSGTLISAVKDAQSVVGLVPRWLTLSWTTTNPANTTVQFQAAASNNANGPFDFVGPDGTASTFFTTTGASLSQFNGFRYLKYKALLSTTDNIVTPALNDVTVCFDNDTPLIASAAPLSRQRAGGAANAQIATASDPAQAANTLTVSSTALTGAGVIINNIFIDSAGKVTADVAASCTATNSSFTLTVTNGANATASATLLVNVTAIDTPIITPGGPTTFCEGGSVTLTSSRASDNQWYLDGNPIGGATNQSYNAISSGDYVVTVSGLGCPNNPSSATAVTVDPIPATPTITPDGPTTFCDGGSVTLTSSSASGNQWYLDGNPIGGATNQAYVATASGNYTDIVTANGCPSAPSAATTVTVNPTPATPTITPDGPTTYCDGGSITLTSSGASGNQWYLNGNPIGGATNQTNVATASGDYTVTTTASGCSSAPAAAIAVTVNPIPATPTITPGGPTTFCESGSVMLTSSSASGNQWYLNGNPMGGATNQTFSATASGTYTVTNTASGCTSGPSAAATVTVNPIPPTPIITPAGPTTFCDSVSLISSSLSGNQWYLNGNPIAGATNQSFNATAAGDYSVMVTTSGCASTASTPTVLTANTAPILTYQNHTVAFDGSLTINPATGPTDDVSVSSIVMQSVGSYAGAISVNNATGVVSISNAAPAGTHTITIRATDSCGTNTVTSFIININKGASTVLWNSPAGIPYGTALGANQLNATASVAGSFTYTPASGTVLDSGNNQVLSVSFMPTDSANYDPASANVAIDVMKASQTITFTTLSTKTLGDSDFTVSATVPSGLSVSFAASGQCTITDTTVHLSGVGSCTITASQSGDSNYAAATSVDQPFIISNASATITLSNMTQTYDGSAKSPTATTNPSGLDVTFSYSQQGSPVTTLINAGTYDVMATISDLTYEGSTSGIVVIDKATPLITWATPTNIIYGTPLDSTQLNATADVPGAFQYNPPDGTVLNVGTDQLSVVFTPTDTANYTTASMSVGLTVDPVTARAFNLDNEAYTVNEGDGHATITINRTGSTANEASVGYATSDSAALTNCSVVSGIASSRCDYPTSVGTLRFAAGESVKTVIIPIINDVRIEGPEVFAITLTNPTGGDLGTHASSFITIIDNDTASATNPIDDDGFFIGQLYIDFLGRLPEPGAIRAWLGILNHCANPTNCDRIAVAQAFVRSSEFQDRGYFVYRFYSAGVGRIAHYDEFITDMAKVSGYLSATDLESNKAAFVEEFMNRSEFKALYDPTISSSSAYVDKLLQTANLPSHPRRNGWIAGLNDNTLTRAQVLGQLMESVDIYTKYANDAYIIMNYFGFLRRDADAAYTTWIQIFNNTGNDRLIINGFMNSGEYRLRFSQ